ncbi:T9SS type A sorting domain-containing protein [candidate division KSB1 bacterium]|nr:T9SS type A sorting domain-containing protein [candidate division KSB1 bacterium]
MKQWVWLFCVLFTMSGLALASNIYEPPEGGWTYKFDGNEWGDDPALDGLWSHDNGSDAWDATLIGDGMPGGVTDYTEIAGDVTTTFIRIQDPGDPRSYGFSDPTNRKIYLHYDITTNDAPAGDATLLDDGITLSFRSRIAVPGGEFELDDLHAADGLGPDDWPATGDGYIIHDGGKGNFGLHQSGGGIISFCLAVKTDHAYLDSVIMKEGLIMNRSGANVNWQGAAADSTFDPASVNLLELDPRVWHEFWVNIQAAADTTGGVTHQVDIYLDGGTEPNTFHVTAGSGAEFANSYLAIGCGATPQSGAYDIDFIAYKPGVHVPAAGNAVSERPVTPAEYALAQNYPNPFNPTTTIQYALARPGHVSLILYDVLGREVRRIVDAFQPAATYSVQIDATELDSGVYFYKLQVGDEFTSMKKMILMK